MGTCFEVLLNCVVRGLNQGPILQHHRIFIGQDRCGVISVATGGSRYLCVRLLGPLSDGTWGA